MAWFSNCLSFGYSGSCLIWALQQVAAESVLADFSDGRSTLDQCFSRSPPSPVGESLLAMVVNDDAGGLTPHGVLRFIASRLAPTGGGAH
ncbi:hypothetical protein PspS34_18450 [Pseudomonas sp. S34]|nr:hypothetical protein PspS34_18450 [Pseudomonas sp. S34]